MLDTIEKLKLNQKSDAHKTSIEASDGLKLDSNLKSCLTMFWP